MKNALKLTFVALGFAAFTTSCNKTEKAAENAGDAAANATENVEAKVDEATTPEAGDTAVMVNKEADAVIEKDAAEANADAKAADATTTTTTTTTETKKK